MTKLHIAAGSLWLAYDVKNIDLLDSMVPAAYRISTVPLYDEREAAPKLLFNIYRVRSEYMRGVRAEVVTMLRHRETRVPRFCVLDCFSDTMRWDPIRRIQAPNAVCRCTERVVDVRTFDGRRLHVSVVPKKSRVRMSKDFMVHANRQNFFSTFPQGFDLDFNATHIAQPIQPLQVSDVTNTFWSEMREEEPTHAFVHTHSMDFSVSNIVF